eukprot:TRINITY_DN1504_c0_g1_i3.p1 TRINITY_DN1504_c0_g1~~TRINITY_DN1504_c0_g1_i3.p1  ORF type:complete len:300 (+),score=73.17 TRINITY_DN1504_c0_g1_i3:2-901(+)
MLLVFFFFFKQKTAYEISACLVGSEMCIRDRNIMEILCQLDDTEFSFDNITTEHGNNFTILFENWDKILSALQNYYQLVLFQNQFPQDFQLMEMLNDDERVYEQNLLNIFSYVLYILLESDKKQVYAQYLGNLKENEQISLIQFYELTKNTVKEGQLQQFVYNKLGSGSPMRNDVDMEDYKFKFDELLHQLTIKENELNELAKAKQEVNVELEKKKKQIDGFAVKEQNWKEKELDYIEKIEKLEEKIETSESCLLYTSDAADEEDSVDLGGGRISKKKNKKGRQMQDKRNKDQKHKKAN